MLGRGARRARTNAVALAALLLAAGGASAVAVQALAPGGPHGSPTGSPVALGTAGALTFTQRTRTYTGVAGGQVALSAACGSGEVAIGGGVEIADPTPADEITASAPHGDSGWHGRVVLATPKRVTVTALCAQA